MFNLNASMTRSTARKSSDYMPTMKLRDNKRIGYSYAYDGTTEAKGTLYPFNFNSNINIGNPSSMFSTEHTGASDYALDYDSYADNAIKYKTAEAYFQNYKKLKSIDIGFIQQELTLATASLFGTSGKIVCKKTYAVSSTTFVMIFTQTSTAGTYAVVGTVNATTGAITFGTSVSLSTVQATSQSIDFAEIGTAKYVVCMSQTATTLRNVVFTVSGTTITAGTPVDKTITTTTAVGNMSRMKVCKVDTDKYIAVWGNDNDQDVYAVCATVSGTVPTVGTEAEPFTETTNQYPSVAMCSTSSGVFLSTDNNSDIIAKGFTLSGTTFTLGSKLTITGTYTASSNGIFKGLPNGLAYYLNAPTKDSFYFALSGAEVSVRYTDDGSNIDTIDGTTWCDKWDVSTSEWAVASTISGVMYLINFKYNSDTGRVDVIRREMASQELVANSLDTNFFLGKCGSQFFVVTTLSTDSTNIYNITFEAGSCEVYFEGEASACATLTNATYGWAMAKQAVNKAIGKNVAYFGLKNKCGHTAFIKTLNWMFEVD